MAKAKTKAAGTNLPVPQNDGEAEQLIARLGALQRDNEKAKADHDAQVAALEEKRGIAKKVFEEVQGVIVDALNLWATANRERLTNGGRTKTVQLPTGTILWRAGIPSVTHRGLKAEEVLDNIDRRISDLTNSIADMRPSRERDVLRDERAVLQGFMRTTVKLNKEAMQENRALAEKVPGITFSNPGESFAVEPLASQIREVA